MDFASLIVREGDRVTASGRVARTETGDWFEPPVPVPATGSLFATVRPAWRGSIRIVGANFDGELPGRFERDRAVEGYATLTGIWTASHLRVEHQTLPDFQHRKIPRWETPPCPPPQGGWPHQTWVYGIKEVQTGDLEPWLVPALAHDQIEQR